MSHNQLERLPASLGGLQSCWQLDVSHNRLAELPRGFSALASLRELDVSDNAIAAIPGWLPQLTGALRAMTGSQGGMQLCAQLRRSATPIFDPRFKRMQRRRRGSAHTSPNFHARMQSCKICGGQAMAYRMPVVTHSRGSQRSHTST